MIQTTLVYNSTTLLTCLLDGTALAKNLNAAWAEGNGGGLDTGSIAANTTFHAHVIAKTADGTLDALLSAAPISPVVPSGWALTGQVAGALLTNGSSQIRPFLQKGNEFRFNEAIVDVGGAANGTTPRLRNLSVPQGVPVQALILPAYTGSGPAWCYAADPDLGVPGPTATWGYVGYRPGSGAAFAQSLRIWTNASGQIYTWDENAAGVVTVITHGWLDPRVLRHAL
jgi:hypothetical protein